MPIDPTRKRPLELTLLHHDLAKGEGVTAAEAADRKRHALDALFFVGVMVDAEEQHKVLGSYDGRAGTELDAENLYVMWLELAAHVARQLGVKLADPALSADEKTRLAKLRLLPLATLLKVELTPELGATASSDSAPDPG